MTDFADGFDGIKGKVLVGQELHDASSCNLETIDLLLAEHLGCIGPAREQVLPLEAWIVAQDFRFRPAQPQQAKQEVDTQSRAFDNWLPDQDVRINNDAIVMTHGEIRFQRT